jgi:phytol kinase
MNSVSTFLSQAWPSLLEVMAIGPGAIILAWGQLSISRSLREWMACRAGHSRKLFHFQVFLTAAFLSSQYGLRPMCIYGVAVSFWAGVSIVDVRGLGRALIRDEDAPRGRRYVVIPYLATLLGGLSTQVWLTSGAATGLLIVGVCDAIAEPVGLRWGRHPYVLSKVPWLKTATRTFEGSMAIALSSGVIFVMTASGVSMGDFPLALWVLGGALGVTLVEALSPHGGDNFTLQLFGAGWVVLFLPV